jgi:hypothetical protein
MAHIVSMMMATPKQSLGWEIASSIVWPNVPKLSHGGKPALEKQNQAATAVGSSALLGHMVKFHKS